MLVNSDSFRRDVGILVHLYQESIRISAAKSLSEEAKIELRQLLDSQVRLAIGTESVDSS